MSYSEKITDPRFDKLIKNSRNYSFQFGSTLAFVAIFGFYLYGEINNEMNNPEAFYIGLEIGAMFFLIGIYSAFSSRRKPDFDAKVIEKKVVKTNDKTYFVIYFEDTKGKKYETRSEDDATLYKYYQIDEKVRYHGKLKTYEKFDKSHDDIIFCNGCSYIHDIHEDVCGNCGCPLLK